MMAERNTYKYHLKKGGKIIHRGITNDLNRREAEHQVQFPGSKLEPMGPRVTRESALKWERTGGKRSYNKS